jgi:hypothetical protein
MVVNADPDLAVILSAPETGTREVVAFSGAQRVWPGSLGHHVDRAAVGVMAMRGWPDQQGAHDAAPGWRA